MASDGFLAGLLCATRRRRHSALSVSDFPQVTWPYGGRRDTPHVSPLPVRLTDAIFSKLTFFWFDLLSPSLALSLIDTNDRFQAAATVGGTATGDPEMPTGAIKRFDTKGLDLVGPEEGGKDAFVLLSAVDRSCLAGLVGNQKVMYKLCTSRDGCESANNIELA